MMVDRETTNERSGVYRIVCRNNEYEYIGQSTNLYSRLREHIYRLRHGTDRNPFLQRDYDKYGENSFYYEIEFADRSCIDALEKALIAEARATGKCYNVFSGGRSGFSTTEEFSARASEINRGKTVSDATKALHAANAKTQWQDAAYRDKMIQSARRQWEGQEYRDIMRKAHLKILDSDVPIIIQLRESGMKVKDIAEQFGVDVSTIYHALKRRV